MVSDSLEKIGSVLIDGFYGYRNAGDEAILASIIQQIRSFDPDARIIVSSSDPSYTTALHDVDGSIYRYLSQNGPPPGEWVSTIRRVNQLWIGGGGLFGERKMLKYALPVAIARTVGTRVATVAVGSGPFDGTTNSLAPSMLNHADAITVRDTQTATTLRGVGVRGPIDVLADPVFGYRTDTETTSLPTELESGLDERTIAVSVREPSDRNVDVDALADALETVRESVDANVLFIPFHANRGGVPSDTAVARRVADRMDGPAPSIWDGELSFRQLLAVIDRSRVLVGMRLHSIIFAARTRTPFVGVPYAPKCVSHLERLAATTDYPCDAIRPDRLAAEIETRWDDGLSAKTESKIDECETIAREIVPTIQSRTTACSRLRAPVLFGQVGVNALKRGLSTG